MLISAATALTRWPERKDFKQTVLLDAAEADAIGADLTTAPIAATPDRSAYISCDYADMLLFLIIGRLETLFYLQTVLLDAADADAIGADVSAADAGSDGGKALSPADAGKRRHVTLMDWGASPVVEITVRRIFRDVATPEWGPQQGWFPHRMPPDGLGKIACHGASAVLCRQVDQSHNNGLACGLGRLARNGVHGNTLQPQRCMPPFIHFRRLIRLSAPWWLSSLPVLNAMELNITMMYRLCCQTMYDTVVSRIV